MLDTILSVKSSSPNNPKSNFVAQKNVGKFQENLDDSISQQKALSHDIKEQKLEATKKEIKELKNKLQEVKELIENSNTEGSKEIESLEKVLEFLTINLESLLDQGNQSNISNNIGIEINTESLVTEINTFIQNVLDSFSQGEQENKDLSLLIQKIAFVLNTVTLEEGNVSSLSQKDTNMLISLFKEIELKNNDLVSLKEQFMVGEKVIDNSSEIKLIDGMEVVDAQEPLDVVSIEDNESQIVEVTAEFEGSDVNSGSDSNSDSQNNDMVPSKISVKDLRNSKNENSVEPFTLETMDAENSTMKTESSSMISENLFSKISAKNDIVSMAQKLYTSLSSSVSRVQVEALMQNVSGKVSMILQDGGNELRMKLTPPELGQMKLSFITEDGMMRGKIIVETQEAKMFFEQNIDNLRDSLAHEGIELGDVDIDLGGQYDFLADDDSQDEEGSTFKAVRINNEIASPNIIRERRSILDTLVDFTA